jgi:CRP-like cAMP-binding protein
LAVGVQSRILIPENRLLARLPHEELRSLWPALKRVELKSRQVLHHWNMPIRHVYFVERGLVSVAARTGPTDSVEVWLVGSDGLVGLPAVLADCDAHPHRRTVQIRGAAFRMTTAELRSAMARLPAFRKTLLSYAEVVLLQSSQSGACNSRHLLRQRLARWLLCAHESLKSKELPLTHEVLGRLLGVRRASVTECLAGLEGEGRLENTRAFIRIEPERLEKVSCVCYRIIRGEFNRVLGHLKPRD